MSTSENDTPLDLLAGTRDMVASMSKPSEEAAKAKTSYTPDQLVIFDSLMTKGTYESTVKLGKGKVTWRTRTSQEQDVIYRMVDNEGFTTPVAAAAAFRKLNVAYAIINFMGKEAGSDVRDRLKLINGLPQPIMSALERSLSKFDEMVDRAVEEVGLENF